MRSGLDAIKEEYDKLAEEEAAEMAEYSPVEGFRSPGPVGKANQEITPSLVLLGSERLM